MSSITQQADPANHRTVVMLRQGERSKLETLAAQEAVSAAEIVRRAIEAYDPDDDDEGLLFAIESMRRHLGEAIQCVREARAEVAETRTQLHTCSSEENDHGGR